MNYGFVIDNRKCIGCHACTVACKSEHQIPLGVNRTHVKYVEKGVFPASRRTFTVTRCNHCEDAPCVEICPTAALFTRRDGIVDFDGDRCIGCKSCMQACPYDALYIDPATQTAAKCNYCAHRIENHYEPACVIVCPVEAIISGDLDNPDSNVAQLAARHQTSVRKPEKGTKPNVFYIDGDHASLNPQAAEPARDYLFSGQAAGVGHYAEYAENRLATQSDQNPNSPADDDEPGRGGVLLAGAFSVSQRAVDDVRRELEQSAAPRRVYDTPDKGVLWGWQVPCYIWTKAVATGVFMLATLLTIFGEQPTQLEQLTWWSTTLVFLALTAGLLVHDLDRPDRFFFVLLRPNWSSWLVRGAYVITGLAGMVGLMLFFSWWGKPDWSRLLQWPAMGLALMGAVYTAFLFGQAKGRDWWLSPLSGFRMLNHALLAGCSVLLLLSPARAAVLIPIFLASLGLNLGLQLLEVVMPHGSADARAAAKLITGGPYRIYTAAGWIFGSVLPLILMGPGAPWALTEAAALLALGGILLTEHVWVRAPQLIPLA